MSALPELPSIPLLRTGQVQIRDFTLEELQKYATNYGDARAAHASKAALEEAAKVAEGYPKYGEATAEEIRNLK